MPRKKKKRTKMVTIGGQRFLSTKQDGISTLTDFPGRPKRRRQQPLLGSMPRTRSKVIAVPVSQAPKFGTKKRKRRSKVIR